MYISKFDYDSIGNGPRHNAHKRLPLAEYHHP